MSGHTESQCFIDPFAIKLFENYSSAGPLHVKNYKD